MRYVLVIDYGMGNLGSVRRAVEESGATALVSDRPDDLAQAERVILPGVGAYRDGMDHLAKRGWIEPLRKTLHEDGIPMLGVCLGMQLLSDLGSEGGPTKGLELVSGSVEPLERKSEDERIPHVGWNEVHQEIDDPLFEGIPTGSDFYFVHSYHFVPNGAATVLARTSYCGSFVSAVRVGRIAGVQFHPEKSGRPGLRLLRNFLEQTC